MPGSLPHVTGSDAGRARFALPLAGLFSTRCLPRRSLARPWRCRRPLSQRHARSFPLAAVRSPTSRLQSPWCAILDRLHVSSFVAPQTKTLKCPLHFATGASDASFQGNLACLLLGYAGGGFSLRAGDARPANGIVGPAAADSTCAGMRSLALIAWHLNLSPVGFYLYSKRFPRHLPNLT